MRGMAIGLLCAGFVAVACSSDRSSESAPVGDAGTTEASTTSDGDVKNDAGACSCNPANATGACDAGVCTITKCNPHRLDCDDNATNGCELADDTSATKCGGCNQSCEDCAIVGIARVADLPVLTTAIKPACAQGICCQGGDAGACVSISLDFASQAGDLSRFSSTKSAPDRTAFITARFRVKTAAGAGIPVTVPNVGDCTLEIDTSPGTYPDFRIDVAWKTNVAAAGSVSTDDNAFTLSQLELADVKLTGSSACTGATPGLGYFIDVLTPMLEPIFRANVCASCPCTTP